MELPININLKFTFNAVKESVFTPSFVSQNRLWKPVEFSALEIAYPKSRNLLKILSCFNSN